MKARFLFAAIAVAYVGHSTSASAQAFLSDPRLTEGLGIKAGDFELHPGVAGEVGYDSNYFQTSGDNTAGPPRIQEPVYDAYRLRITPSLSFASHGARAGQEGGGPAPTLNLKGHAAASYNALFFGSSDNIASQNNVSGTAGVGADILPAQRWGGDVSADYTRVLEASNEAAVSNAYKRDALRGAANIIWRPGGGLFSWKLGYAIAATLFEDASFQTMNNLKHTLSTGGSWKFLPRTAIFYRGNLSWLDYVNSNAPTTLSGGMTADSQLGLNGLISNYFGLLAMGGWASTFYAPAAGKAQNYDSFVGQAQVTWYPSPQHRLLQGDTPVGLSSVAAGYTRNIGQSYLGTYYQRDRGYLNGTYFFGEKFVLALAGGFSHITRPATYFNTGAVQLPGGTVENRVDALAFLEYRLSPTVGANLTFRYDAELSNVAVPLDPGNPAQAADQLQFSRYQAYLGLRWFL
jgi:hypothetical protein